MRGGEGRGREGRGQWEGRAGEGMGGEERAAEVLLGQPVGLQVAGQEISDCGVLRPHPT